MKIAISGGASGIGLALALHYGQSGAQVFVVDISPPHKPFASAGVQYLQADVTNEQALEQAFSQIGRGIDVLISNAGIIRRGALFATTPAEFDTLFAVNVKGSWLFVREAMPFLKPGATILQMSSGHAMDPPDDPGVYALTKMCLANFADLLTRHYEQFVIKVAYPGPVETPLAVYGLSAEEIAAKKSIMHSPEYAAEHIVKLLESNCRELRFNDERWDYDLVQPAQSALMSRAH